MKNPNLLLKSKLLTPISQALNRLEKIRERKSSNDDPIILEGLFILAVSSFENSISDTLKILLRQFPEKIKSKTIEVSKDDILSGGLINKVTERIVVEKSYKSLKDFLNFFFQTTGIEIQAFFENDDFKYLIEIKATRNILIHNNLHINSFYIDSSGEKARAKNGTLSINQDYLFQSIMTLKGILLHLEELLNDKYARYTKVNAIRNLFDYTFSTPIMSFDNEWEVDLEEDKIICHKEETSRRGALSSSEKFFYNIWLAHVSGAGQINLNLSIYSLDNKSRAKLGILVDNIDLLKN